MMMDCLGRLFQSESKEGEGVDKLHSKVVLQRASAWYMATYDPAYQPDGWDPATQMYSFPWVLHMYLADIKNAKEATRRSE